MIESILKGWLEPLLERIKLNPKSAACPVIEEVNDKTFQYRVSRKLLNLYYFLTLKTTKIYQNKFVCLVCTSRS